MMWWVEIVLGAFFGLAAVAIFLIIKIMIDEIDHNMRGG